MIHRPVLQGGDQQARKRSFALNCVKIGMYFEALALLPYKHPAQPCGNLIGYSDYQPWVLFGTPYYPVLKDGAVCQNTNIGFQKILSRH